MKNVLKLIALAAVAMVGFALHAAPPPTYSYYTAYSTNGATTLPFAVVGANSSIPDAQAVVTSVAGITDLATARVQFFRTVAKVVCSYTNSTTTCPVTSTNTGHDWTAGSSIIRHVYNDTYERRTLTANTGSTNIVWTAAPLGEVRPGDIIYLTTTVGPTQFQVSTNTQTASGYGLFINMPEGMFVGQPGMPILVDLTGTTSATLYGVTAKYVKSKP